LTHVVENDLVLARDGERERTARGHRRQQDTPLAVRGRRGGNLLSGHFHRDGFPRPGRAPNRDLHALLEDGVIDKERVGGYLGAGHGNPARQHQHGKAKGKAKE
jgi:hypothetical protein